MSLEQEIKAVLDTNTKFYHALGTRDLELMDQIWVQDQRAGCVHPGWVMLKEWHAIRQSWENVFDPEDQVDIKLSNVEVDIKGDIAWVTCIQEMIYVKRDPIMANISQSTNIFERSGSGWLMVIHHASPIPLLNHEIQKNNLQ
ncbi:MAG: nuclear transport factor 2 family protein [Thermodesulfobacteriota bacterium]